MQLSENKKALLRTVVAKIMDDGWRKGIDSNMVTVAEVDEWVEDILFFVLGGDKEKSE